jgi:Cdc6-like AAA superfamily ATPase
MPVLLRDWFCLKPGRDNFKPHNERDSRLVFCHQHLLNDEIKNSIEQRFSANEPVKMLILGDWGVGKTHAVNHIRMWLEDNKADYPAFPVVIEIPDIEKNTRFDILVRQFLKKLGIGFVIDLVHGYKAANPNLVQALRDAGVSPLVAEAYAKFLLAMPGDTPPPNVKDSFEYLQGTKLTGDAARIGLGQQLTDSADFFSVLLAIGEMHRVVRNCRMIFIADEAAKLETVDANDATRAHWVSVNKSILDDNNRTFGFIYTISARRDQLPASLYEPQLQNRLGDNVYEIMNLEPADIGTFLTNLTNEFVSKSAVEALIASGEIDATKYRWEDYPFTVAARIEFVDFFNRSLQDAKPRDICNKLYDAAFIASKTGKRLIDEACLRAAKM